MLNNSSFSIKHNDFAYALIASSYIGVAISYSDFYLFHFILLIFSVFSAYIFKEDNFRLNITILSKKYVISLILFFSWYILSLFWSPSIVYGLKYIFYIFCGLAVSLSFIYYSSNIINLNKIFFLLSVLVLIDIGISLLESFSMFRMPISSHSTISHLFGKDPVNFSNFDNIYFYSSLRPPTGFHWNTNDLAICMAISFPFFLCHKKNIVKILGIFFISIIVAMSASRAVFLALILIYFLYLFLIKKKIGTLLIIWVTSISIFWGITQLGESENPRINELANSVEALKFYLNGDVDIGGSIEWRRELIENGFEAFTKTYGIGLGAGGSTVNQELIGPVAGRFTSMHNFWIELLVEGGIFTALIMTFWMIGLIYKLFLISKTTANKHIKYYSQSLFLSLSAFVPAAIAASSTIYFFPMWIMFGFAISVILLSNTK